MSSLKLFGGISVAYPAEIPVDPLTNKLGIRAGNTVGSFSVSSKFKVISTVSLSISRSIKPAILLSRASVYRIAAGGSPSIEPLLPCISTNGSRSFQS